MLKQMISAGKGVERHHCATLSSFSFGEYLLPRQLKTSAEKPLSPVPTKEQSKTRSLQSHFTLGMEVWEVGEGDKHKPSFLFLFPSGLAQGSVELVEMLSPVCTNSGLGLSTSREARLTLERSKSHPSTPSFWTACCMDLMQQKLYTETSFSTDDSKVCKFSKVSSSDMEIE